MDKSKQKIVYFVRHGESEANISDVFQHPDTPLTPNGRRQAKLIAERAKKIPFEKFISSPLPRTKDTAAAITEATGNTPEYSELFVERIKPKRLGGKPHGDVEAEKLYKLWMASLHEGGPKAEDGETFDEIVDRADKALSFLEKFDEKTLLVVTHGYFLKVMLARILFGDLLTPEILQKFETRAKTENTGVSVIKFGAYQRSHNEGTRWYLWIFNDHAHLG